MPADTLRTSKRRKRCSLGVGTIEERLLGREPRLEDQRSCAISGSLGESGRLLKKELGVERPRLRMEKVAAGEGKAVADW